MKYLDFLWRSPCFQGLPDELVDEVKGFVSFYANDYSKAELYLAIQARLDKEGKTIRRKNESITKKQLVKYLCNADFNLIKELTAQASSHKAQWPEFSKAEIFHAVEEALIDQGQRVSFSFINSWMPRHLLLEQALTLIKSHGLNVNKYFDRIRQKTYIFRQTLPHDCMEDLVDAIDGSFISDMGSYDILTDTHNTMITGIKSKKFDYFQAPRQLEGMIRHIIDRKAEQALLQIF